MKLFVWELVVFQSLSLVMLRDWLDFVFMDWLIFVLSCSGAECISLALVSEPRCVSFTGAF